jgi:hypothetical protein
MCRDAPGSHLRSASSIFAPPNLKAIGSSYCSKDGLNLPYSIDFDERRRDRMLFEVEAMFNSFNEALDGLNVSIQLVTIMLGVGYV